LADKKKPQLDQNRFGASQNRKSFSFIRKFFYNQIEPIFDRLYDQNFDEMLKPPLRNYLTISLVWNTSLEIKKGE
jgi:hypothetical protein